MVDENGGILCGCDPGMMLESSAEQATEITTTAIDLELLPTVTNVERGVRNLELVLQQMHTALMALTWYEANDLVVNSRKNPLEAWQRLQKRFDLTTSTGKRNLLRTVISPEGAPFWNFKRESNDGNPTCRALGKS